MKSAKTKAFEQWLSRDPSLLALINKRVLAEIAFRDGWTAAMRAKKRRR